MNEGTDRDRLAEERTHLANERTLFAYVRTALALVGGGAALLQYLPKSPFHLKTAVETVKNGCLHYLSRT